jgi:hypothetical protein
MNLKRDEQVFNAYIDLKSSPSTLQKRPDIPTSVERSEGRSIYENERDAHYEQSQSKIAKLASVRDKLFAKPSDNASLSTPKEKRDEVTRIKKEMEEYREFKKQ